MPRSPSSASLIARLERIQDLSHDLAHELAHRDGETDAARAMAKAIKEDSDAVDRALNRPKS